MGGGIKVMRCLLDWEVGIFEVCAARDEKKGGGVMHFRSLAWAGVCGIHRIRRLDWGPRVVLHRPLSDRIEAVDGLGWWWGGGRVWEEGVGEYDVADFLRQFVVEGRVGLWIYWPGEDLLSESLGVCTRGLL